LFEQRPSHPLDRALNRGDPWIDLIRLGFRRGHGLHEFPPQQGARSRVKSEEVVQQRRPAALQPRDVQDGRDGHVSDLRVLTQGCQDT
jgi:hypothetical protein